MFYTRLQKYLLLFMFSLFLLYLFKMVIAEDMLLQVSTAMLPHQRLGGAPAE